ncbi:MAG: RnfABCDGE type electron transport complex subunit G [Culturomica sp.]|jgi:electron transport complex protein RnfG|nr:RnfABCDGE type electron transport complex subunit G [Culturomica sp.]
MGKKLESNFKNMVAVLFVVTLVISGAVGYVYSLTEKPMEEVKKQKQVDAIKAVIPTAFNNDPFTDSWKVSVSGSADEYAYLYTAKAPDSIEIYPAKMNGKLVGTAVKSFSDKGFGGKVWVMVGFLPNGDINNYSVLEHKETPGLGTGMTDWFTKNGPGSIIGMNPQTKELKVSKDGGDIDAITAATISSRAFLQAVNSASDAIADSADASSGATTTNN